ncbi:hypothetical protein OP10G_2261 [Fimbriimonas ginsengisoli Gsoil 348]|uniref:Uncharacterized protein n=2 Tax=Fimbriimonas ginsengisoli TaxID=1005039 RepID=A0A068NVM1_FIMGI|nr:hypothetical protein OP10G_2261 [Fimbriimonas ginsengisoli Gsoil 348]
MVPLKQAVKDLSKDAGFTLEAATVIWPLKVTILVKDQPIGTVMDRVAGVFHGEWKRDGDLYRLSIPSEWRNSESAFVEAENKERRREAEEAIEPLMAGAAVPYQQVMDELKKPVDPKAKNSKRPLYEKVSAPENYLLGYMFRRMTQAQWQQFWGGRTMSTVDFLPADDSASKQPATTAPTRTRRNGTTSGAAGPKAIRATASYDPLTGHLALNEANIGTAGRLIDRPYPSGELAKLPFAKEVLEWNRGEEDSTELGKPVNGSPKRPYFGGQASAADVLEWLHDQSGVPIVADAFRTYVNVPNSGATISARLNSFKQANNGFMRIDKGFVSFRYGGFWRLKTMEAPEEYFAAIEKSATPKLDDYADLALKLSDLQVLPFRVGAGLLKVDPEPLRTALPALRFYGSLSSGQRRTASAGQPLQFGALSVGSRELFLYAMEDPSGQRAGRPLNLQDPSVAQSLGFLMTSTTAPRGGVVSAAISMLFGTRPGEGVRYMVPIG